MRRSTSSSTRRSGSYPNDDVLEHDLARAWRKNARLRSVSDLLGLVEDLEDPLARRDRSLRLADPHAEHPQRHDEHREQEVEGGERSQRHRARDDHPSADEQHESERDHRKEREQGDVDGALAIRRERLREDGVGGGCEAIRPPVLLRERLDDVNAGDRLLGDGRDLAERLLDVAEHGLRHMAVAVRHQGDHRRDGERHERQLPAVDEQDERDDDDGDDVLREEDEPVAEEEPHRLEVDRRARHQLPRLAAVVEAEREPEEVRVELVAHVVLHRERLPPGDHSSPVHERAAQEPERDDRADLEHEHPRVRAPVDLVDHDARQNRNEDACHLGGDREERRDGERYPVRAQESEQPAERAPAAPRGASGSLSGTAS